MSKSEKTISRTRSSIAKNEEITELVKQAKLGDTTAFDRIYDKLEPQIRNQCKRFYFPGGDNEDILQEARLGLLKAIHDYNNFSYDTSFENFALRVCIRRHLITTIATARRGKSAPLNTSYSLDIAVVSDFDDNHCQTIGELITDDAPTPLMAMVSREEIDYVKNTLYNKLTSLEAQVLEEYEKEFSYKEIAVNLKISEKCVDNSLMRIRKKAKEIDESELEIRE